MKRKKFLLGLLLVPALMLTGCPLNDDTSPKVEQNEETQKTEQETLDERYTMLHNLAKSTFNVEDAIVTIEELTDIKYDYKINENQVLTEAERAEYEKFFEEYSTEFSSDYIMGYNLIDGTYYEEEYRQNSQEEGYYLGQSTYITKKNDKYIMYEMGTSWSDGVMEENKSAYYVDKDHTKKAMLKESVSGSYTGQLIEHVTNNSTINDFKEDFVTLLKEEELPGEVEDIHFYIEENDGVYTVSIKIVDKEFKEVDSSDSSAKSVFNIEVKINFDNEKIISLSWDEKGDVTGFAMPVDEDKALLVDVNFEGHMVRRFGKSFDNRKLYQNFLDYGTIENAVAITNLYLNGVRVSAIGSLFFGIPYGTSVLDSSVEENLTTGYKKLNEIITGEFYIDEECTKRYYREFDVWPSYEINIYAKVDETKIGETRTLAFIEHVYTDYSYSEGKILTLAEYTDNSIDLNTLANLHDEYEVEEILLDGVVVSNNVNLTNRRIINITIKYKAVE